MLKWLVVILLSLHLPHAGNTRSSEIVPPLGLWEKSSHAYLELGVDQSGSRYTRVLDLSSAGDILGFELKV